jgi:hypothetical protein
LYLISGNKVFAYLYPLILSGGFLKDIFRAKFQLGLSILPIVLPKCICFSRFGNM